MGNSCRNISCTDGSRPVIRRRVLRKRENLKGGMRDGDEECRGCVYGARKGGDGQVCAGYAVIHHMRHKMLRGMGYLGSVFIFIRRSFLASPVGCVML